MRTRWLVETRALDDGRRLTVELQTDDPELARLVEDVARDAGVELVRLLAPGGDEAGAGAER